ncbi:MAG: hypothetical protein GEV04_13085 [Actinophytocola sp.]|nr:hypothetical protein [Actinophytocola sp.]
MMKMVSEEDREELAQAAELLTHVMERHRSEDLRAVSVFTAALQDIRIGQRYLDNESPTTEPDASVTGQGDIMEA